MNLTRPLTYLILAEIILFDLEIKVKTPTREALFEVSNILADMPPREILDICMYFNSDQYLKDQNQDEIPLSDVPRDT